MSLQSQRTKFDLLCSVNPILVDVKLLLRNILSQHMDDRKVTSPILDLGLNTSNL